MEKPEKIEEKKGKEELTANETESKSGKSSTGLDENIAGALAYVLGFVTGIFFLVVEKNSKFVKFHALQSTIVFGIM